MLKHKPVETFARDHKRLKWLKCLNVNGLHDNEIEVDTLEMLSSCLEEAIENGMEVQALPSRANGLAHYALTHDYAEHEVENLLTMRHNPNGKRLPKS